MMTALNRFTKPLETSTRKKIDSWLTNLGWDIDEESPNCNVVTERGFTQEQKRKLKGKQPDYLLLKSGTFQPIAVIEAKTMGKNLDQALKDAIQKYADPLEVPTVFATDGTFIRSWHVKDGKELTINEEPLKELVSEKIILRFVEQGHNIEAISESVKHSREELIKIFEWTNNLLRKEGLRGLDRFVEFANILFLKLISEIEEDKERTGEKRILDRKYCWDSFAQLPPETMMGYLNGTVLPYLVEHYNKTGDVFQKTMQISNPNNLKSIVDRLSELTLINTESEIKGDAFEYFLKSLTTGNDLGEYFTPRHIVRVMTKLINPQYGEKVYDPCCGTGGFLIEAFRHIKKLCKLTLDTINKLKNDTVFGIELTNTARIAKMNMILAGDGHTNIHQADSLENPMKNKFDVVLTNFPFSQRTDYGHLYGLHTDDGNVVFLKHIIDALDNEGRAGVVSFQGVLYDSNKIYTDIRKYLLEQCDVEAVIKLHNYVFRPYSGANTSILIFKKGRPTKKVWFFNVENDGFEKTSSLKGRYPINENDLDLLEGIWSTKEDSKRSWTAEYEEIKRNNYSLNAETYEPRKRLGSKYKLEKLSEFIDVGKERGTTNNLPYLEIGDIDLYSKSYLHKNKKSVQGCKKAFKNDIVISTVRPSRGAITQIKEENIDASSAFLVVRSRKSKIRDRLLFLILAYNRKFYSFMRSKQRGSTYPTIKEKDMLAFEIPNIPLDDQNVKLKKWEKRYAVIRSTTFAIRTLRANLFDSILFDGDYEKVNINDLMIPYTLQNGLYKGKKYYGKGTYIIRINNFYDGMLLDSNLKKLELTEDEKEKYLLKKGDILINRVNTEKFVGKCCVFDSKEPEVVFESNIMRFRVNEKVILPEYLVFYLSSEEGKRRILTKIKRAVNQVSINQEDVKSIIVPLPDIDTQKKVITEIKRNLFTVIHLEEIKENNKKHLEEEIDNLYELANS